jgi:uncharacterized membrane protein YhdT
MHCRGRKAALVIQIYFQEDCMKRSEKFRRANHEAKVTCLATLAVIIFWTVAGFGLSSLDITFFDTPVWVLAGCIGTWLFAVLVAFWLAEHVISDIDLDEEDAAV